MANNSPKYRDYFITINKGAPSYEEALQIVKELNYKLYALILHDKDYIVNEDGETTKKAPHKHIVVELKNPVSFNAMQERFKGAHIEIPKYKKSAYQYLIHNLPNARDKYQYELTEIISNDVNAVKVIIETETSELFKQSQFLLYMVEGTRTEYQFVKRFGMDAYKQYWSVYEKMLLRLPHDEEMQHDYELIQKDMENNEL